MRIHTIGDSHSYKGWWGISELETHHLGPKLCFSIGRDGINIREGYNIKNGDAVIFCFGEIDCRNHIYKHITEENTYTQIIDSIVDNYFIKIKDAIETFDTLKTSVYNVIPPSQEQNAHADNVYPFLGTDNERKAYVLYFNKKLQEKCIEYNFLFFNVYDKYIDTNGFLNRELSDGNVHIGNGKYLKQFIDNNILSNTACIS
jgi:hypothetical protein